MKTLQVYPSELTEGDVIKINDNEIKTIKDIFLKNGFYKITYYDNSQEITPSNKSVEVLKRNENLYSKI